MMNSQDGERDHPLYEKAQVPDLPYWVDGDFVIDKNGEPYWKVGIEWNRFIKIFSYKYNLNQLKNSTFIHKIKNPKKLMKKIQSGSYYLVDLSVFETFNESGLPKGSFKYFEELVSLFFEDIRLKQIKNNYKNNNRVLVLNPNLMKFFISIITIATKYNICKEKSDNELSFTETVELFGNISSSINKLNGLLSKLDNDWLEASVRFNFQNDYHKSEMIGLDRLLWRVDSFESLIDDHMSDIKITYARNLNFLNNQLKNTKILLEAVPKQAQGTLTEKAIGDPLWMLFSKSLLLMEKYIKDEKKIKSNQILARTASIVRSFATGFPLVEGNSPNKKDALAEWGRIAIKETRSWRKELTEAEDYWKHIMSIGKPIKLKDEHEDPILLLKRQVSKDLTLLLRGPGPNLRSRQLLKNE